MADHLLDIFGTEKDKVNCPFYWKIGACRHGDRCSRIHNRPTFSQTLLIPKMYPNPKATPLVDANGQPVEYGDDFLAQHFEDFYEDVFLELSKYGELEELHVCDNLCQHLLGNVYAKFYREEDTQKAHDGLRGRFYAGRSLAPELCPVTDFREARCRQYETNECQRGGYCNFLHLRDVPRSMLKDLFKEQLEKYHDREHTSDQLDNYYNAYKSKSDKRRGDDDRGRRRSPSPRRDRHYDSDRSRDRDREHRDRDPRDKERVRERERERDRDYDRERSRSPKRSKRSRSPEREPYAHY